MKKTVWFKISNEHCAYYCWTQNINVQNNAKNTKTSESSASHTRDGLQTATVLVICMDNEMRITNISDYKQTVNLTCTEIGKDSELTLIIAMQFHSTEYFTI